MTSPPSSPVPPNPEPGPRRGGRLGAVVVLVLVALAGVIAGVALDRLRFIPHMFGGLGHGPGAHEWGPGGGPPRDHGFRDRFAHELGLSPEQQIRIDSIMDRQGRGAPRGAGPGPAPARLDHQPHSAPARRACSPRINGRGRRRFGSGTPSAGGFSPGRPLASYLPRSSFRERMMTLLRITDRT